MRIPPALHAIYDDNHPFIVVQKPAQIGMTECNVNVAFHAALTMRGGRGHVGYIMPTQENADRLSQDRIARAIRESRSLQSLINDPAGGVRGPQRMQMRQVGDGLVYLTGADQPSQYTGLDLDLVILDEYDLMKEDILPQAIGRLRSSKRPQLRVTSTPTIPEFGINGLLEQSDLNHYELRCANCGIWLEPSFPEQVDFERNLVVCNCGAELSPYLPGRWVPRRPDRNEIRGYQLNRLTLPDPPLAQMRLAANGTIGMRAEEFWRLDLGVPYVSSDSRISIADLDRCRVEPPPPILAAAPDAVVMGIDVGVHCFWVVIRGFFKKRSFLLFAGRVEGDWDGLVALAKQYKVTWCAVDALPDTRGAMMLQRMLQDAGAYVFICYYNRQHAHDYDWGPPATINAARTLALDETFDAFRRQHHLLPADARSLTGGAYYEHMQALVRTTTPDDFGQPIPTYRHTRPDDFAHAENYLTLIANIWGQWGGWWE